MHRCAKLTRKFHIPSAKCIGCGLLIHSFRKLRDVSCFLRLISNSGYSMWVMDNSVVFEFLVFPLLPMSILLFALFRPLYGILACLAMQLCSRCEFLFLMTLCSLGWNQSLYQSGSISVSQLQVCRLLTALYRSKCWQHKYFTSLQYSLADKHCRSVSSMA